MDNLLPKKEKEPIADYIRRLGENLTDPDSDLWKTYREHLGLSPLEWVHGFEKPDAVFPFPHTLWDINCGHCETIEDLLERNFPGGEEVWLDELYLNDKRCLPNGFAFWTKEEKQDWIDSHNDSAPAHVVYKLDGKFYDAQNPEGVRDWRNLEAWKNRRLTRSQWKKQFEE